MIDAAEFEALVHEVLALEDELEELGNVTRETSQGTYAMREQALSDGCMAQAKYNKAKASLAKKKRLIEAFDMIARYKLAKGG